MSNAGGFKSLNRYYDMLAGNDAFVPISGAYDSIATTTVGAGGAASITFSSIPATYTHLQIRAISHCTDTSSTGYGLYRFNSDTGANYASHVLFGNGSVAGANTGLGTSTTRSYWGTIPSQASASFLSSSFAATVVDILDYTNTSKYKTTRILHGQDQNTFTTGGTEFISGLWQSTAAISSITLGLETGTNFFQYSSFALYGIKGA